MLELQCFIRGVSHQQAYPLVAYSSLYKTTNKRGAQSQQTSRTTFSKSQIGFHLIQDRSSEIVCSAAATHIPRSYLAVLDHLVHGRRDSVGVLIQTKMSQQHGTREHECSWVGLVLAFDVETDVTAAWLEDSNVSTHIASWNHTWTSDKGCSDICENT